MTTRPTDEEIRAMASSCEQAACGEMNPYGSDLFATARFLHAHIAERQAARDGVELREEAHKLFHYDPDTGILTRRISNSNRFAGEQVGSSDDDGYLRTRFDGKLQKVHRIVWLYVYGALPTVEIDHINGIPSDNRISNLRLATREIQTQNTATRSDSPLGMKNISKTENGTFCAEYSMGRVRHKVGKFKTVEEAQTALYEHKKKNGHPDVTRNFIQSIAQPITSVSDALNFLEEWALSGNKLHGDDIQQFHATVERIAPVEQSARVPDEKSEVWVVQDETGCPIYCASYAQACHEHINDAINEHGIEEACAWKVIHYENSTSPQPQQAVPDGWKLVPVEANSFMKCMADIPLRNFLADPSGIAPTMKTAQEVWKSMLFAAPAYNGKKEG